jgi:hypothetical protein
VAKVDISMEKRNDSNNKGLRSRQVYVLWILKTILGGMIYATSAFFTRQYWEMLEDRTIKLFRI